jgi:hypothetical protein
MDAAILSMIMKESADMMSTAMIIEQASIALFVKQPRKFSFSCNNKLMLP